MAKKKFLLDLRLPQHRNQKKTTEELYKLFRRRVSTKSNFVPGVGENPKALILSFYGTEFSTQMGVIITSASFEVISKGKNEIGFQAKIANEVFGNKFVLFVFKDGRAFLEKV